jgi:putative ABC transport system permease protein
MKLNWISLAGREWQRRPLRTTVTASGVGIATAAMFSLLSFQHGYREGVRHELERLGAHILLVPKGCPYDAASMALHGATWPCYLRQSYLDEVRHVTGVASAAPVFMSVASEGQENGTVYVGIDTNILALQPGWRIQGVFCTRAGSLLAGAEAARRNGWHLGEHISLPGLSNHAASVDGILESTHSYEDSFLHLPLREAQLLFGHTNELTHILVRLADPNDLERAVTQLRGCDAGMAMNVVPLTHVFRTIQSLVNSTRLLLGCVAVVAFLVAGTGITNSVLMAIAERTRDIGIMRSFGASRGHIFCLICLETIHVAIGGALAGIAVAYGASGLVDGWIRSSLPFAPPGNVIQWHWGIAILCVLCAFVLGVLAALLPATRAASIPPAVAIQSKGGIR